jgi:hypothetical protein
MTCPITIELIIDSKDDPQRALVLYDKLIEYYRINPTPRHVYSEIHHIIPRCMGGNDEPDNLIALDAATHFDAHLLLALAYRDHQQAKKLRGAIRVLLGKSTTFSRVLAEAPEMRLRYQQVRDIDAATFLANKQIYLDMIAQGKHRPHETTYLGKMLNSYTSKGCSYRPGLKQELIDSGGEYWFLDSRFEAQRQEALQLVRDRKPRPLVNTKLGRALSQYLSAGGPRFRPEFRAEIIEKGGAYWFYDERYEQNRTELLRMARNGLERPNFKTQLGAALDRYCVVNGPTYRQGLKEELVAAGAARWFLDLRYEDNKRQYLEMIAEGKSRPHFSTYLGKALNSYLSDKCEKYRPGLKEELIAAGGAEWFENHRHGAPPKIVTDEKGRSQTIVEWAQELGVTHGTIRLRLKKYGSPYAPKVPAD